MIIRFYAHGMAPVNGFFLPEAFQRVTLPAIAERYLAIPCSCMSPNRGRFELVARLAREFQADGVVDLTWMACHTYNIESYGLRRYLQEKGGWPFLPIETDYSDSDTEQLKIRIEAFGEILSRRQEVADA